MDEIKREYLSTERSPVIDPELRDLLPPITDEEREALTADILKNGCYSPMICMEDMTLVDGHHRYGICTEHGIPYRMVVLDFADKLDAKEWMVNTQKGRRNLSSYQIGQIGLKLKPEYDARALKNKQDAMEKARKANPNNQSEQFFQTSEKTVTPSVNTTKEIANAMGISHDTMNKVIQIEESAPAPIKEALAKDLISVNKAYGMTKKLKDMPEEEREEAAKELLRQDEMKQYRQIDEDSAVAKAVNDALYKVSKIDSSERAVRLWIEYCCIEDIALRRDLQLAQMAAENMRHIASHIKTIMEERNVDPYVEKAEAEQDTQGGE